MRNWTALRSYLLVGALVPTASVPALLSWSGLVASSAWAAPAVIAFDIPRGSLGAVLTAIAGAGGETIAFSADLTAGRVAGPIKGTSSIQAALAKALAGSGLVVVAGEGGVLTVKGPAKTASSGASGAALDIADIDVSGNASQFHDDGFQAGDAGATVRIADAPAKEIPITISTVTNDVIKSEAIVSVTNAVQNVAGVNVAPSANGNNANFNIRGFQSTSLAVNGVIGDNYGSVPIDDVDRVEVLKGPTSILTGTTEDGGLVNVTTKQPTSTTIRDVTVRYGSFGYKTLAFDLGGIVPQTEGLTYRFNISGNTADQGYGGYKDPHEFLVSPSIKWEDKDTSVLFGVRYVDTKVVPPPVSFIPFFNTGDDFPELRLPRNVTQGNDYYGTKRKSVDVYVIGSHDFGTVAGINVKFNNTAQFTKTVETTRAFQFNEFDDFLGLNDNLYDYQQVKGGASFYQFTERPDVTLKYDAGFMKTLNKFGFDLRSTNVSFNSSTGDDTYINPYTGSPRADLFNPSSPSVLDRSLTQTSGFYYLNKTDTFNDRLHILGSVRIDHFQTLTHLDIPAASYTYSRPGSQYSPSWNAGGAFDVTKWMTVYGNRSNGFYQNAGALDGNGNALPPQGRDLSEVGARFFLLDKKLSLTASFYKLNQTNVSTQDPTDPLGLTYILVGGEQSRGFEFEAQGEILPGWNVTASFADSHATFTNPDVGTSIPAAPQYTANLWTTYAVQTGVFSGVHFGFGVHGNTESLTVNGDGLYYKVPGYVVEDALIGYTHGNYSLDLKLNNLANRYFYYPTYAGLYIPIGEGRNFMLTGKYSF